MGHERVQDRSRHVSQARASTTSSPTCGIVPVNCNISVTSPGIEGSIEWANRSAAEDRPAVFEAAGWRAGWRGDPLAGVDPADIIELDVIVPA